MKLHTIVVDDEELARERLKTLLRPFDEIEVVGEAGNGEDAIELITKLDPDLVFLDIQMPGCSGIEVAASLPEAGPRVIFCTAYDQYAIDAFEVEAVDYLLKPVSRARLAAAVEKVEREPAAGRGIERVFEGASPNRFLGKRGNRFFVVAREDVHYFFSEGGLTQLWTKDVSYWMEPSLNQLENRLAGTLFFRVSRQALVNLDAIDEVIPLVGGHGQVKLRSGKILDVSRRRLKELLVRLEGE